MAAVIAAGNAGHVWLDATGFERDLLEDGFPTVTAACRKHGIDPVTAMIPVAPGAHYSCGGIRADLDGRTSLPGLYAAGEAASTGVQGANRLASNSVTEAIISGRRTGTDIARALALTSDASRSAPANWPGGAQGQHGAVNPTADEPLVTRMVTESPNRGEVADRRELAQAMSQYAGVMRDADGLAELLRVIGIPGDIPGPKAGDVPGSNAPMAPIEAGESANEPGRLELADVEALNLRTVSLLIAAGAQRRAESRGCHRRRDAAGTATTPWHTLARWDGRELVMSEEEL
jgi:L-aspartate oxidase